MKSKRQPEDFLAPDSIPPQELRTKLAQRPAKGAPAMAAIVVAGEIPDAENPPPIPSMFDLLKREFNLHIEHAAPEWARLAAGMAFDSLTPKRRKRAVSDAYNIGFDSGYVEGAADALASLTPGGQGWQIGDGVRECSAALKEFWAGQPAGKAADFFCGFRDGEKLMRGVPERARQMAQRTKILCAITSHWKEIAPGVLHHTGELHQWLLAQNVISPRTDAAETRLVCTKIGLRYKSPGKPRKSKM